MSQHSTVPEYTLEKPLEETLHSTVPSNSSSLDLLAVVADLVGLLLQVKQLTESSQEIHIDMARLVQSLSERV